jgi:hypothetical protein
MLGGLLIVGSQAERDSHAVLPPVGELYECPPGTDPDEPGPVDQARPATSGPVAFDRRAGKLVVLAGGEASVQTWTFDVCTNTWTRKHPDREPPMLTGGLVYDVDSDLTIGVVDIDTRTESAWIYDLGADTWTERGVAPTNAVGFYDPVSGLVYAGAWDYDVETDTWSPAAWGGKGCHMCVYDASVDRLIMYNPEGVAPEMWLLDRTGVWRMSGAETPDCTTGSWWYPAVVYDEAAERTVVANGHRWCVYDATADRWEILFDEAEWVPNPGAYDPANRRLIVFGDGVGVSGEAVAFDLVRREWTVLIARSDGEPAPSPG